ncbi:hypothetical protein RJ640_004817 [Escallonia rubra]|uniref:Uncharacterized protein n=1 Tax=Escallonia rubra TaxID=112253 RepID=A0AA88UM20_9ASTE|nr:hypothetical protein RJ640_004817 [Escallonia rubra]
MSTEWEEAFHQFENVIESDSEVLRLQSMRTLAHLSKQAPESILERTVPILVGLLESSPRNSSPLILKASAYCLKCITCQGEGRLAEIVGLSGAIASIVSLLQPSEGSLQRVLLKCLRNIVSFADASRMILVREGGLEVILNMLNSSPDGFSRLLLEILSALVLLKEVRRAIVTLGGIHFVVESARSGSMISRARAAQAIGLLGLVRRVRHMLVDSGGIQVLIDLLRVGDMPTKLIAGNALGVISSHVDYIRPVALAGAIPLYSELLHGPESMGKEIAEDVFCILAIAEENATSIAEHLVQILRGSDDEAKAAAADVLWGLSGYEHSLSVVRNSGAIPVLVEILRSGSLDLREKVSGALAQLSYNEADRVALADGGAIPLLVEMLQDESEELRDNVAEALVNFSEDPLLCDRISNALNVPSFQRMQDRLTQSRASDAHLAASLRRMSIEQFTWDPGLV